MTLPLRLCGATPSARLFVPSRRPRPCQVLGRLPWFAFFLRRARRLRPVLLMTSPQVLVLVIGRALSLHPRRVRRGCAPARCGASRPVARPRTSRPRHRGLARPPAPRRGTAHAPRTDGTPTLPPRSAESRDRCCRSGKQLRVLVEARGAVAPIHGGATPSGLADERPTSRPLFRLRELVHEVPSTASPERIEAGRTGGGRIFCGVAVDGCKRLRRAQPLAACQFGHSHAHARSNPAQL